MNAGHASRGGGAVTPSRLVLGLSLAVAALALAAALAGLLVTGGDGLREFVTARGDTVQLFGKGLYRYDSAFFAGGYRGSDVVTVFLAVPVLLAGLVTYARGSLRGGLVVSGALAYTLYVYATMALNASFNALFPLYVALFSLSLWALAKLLGSAGLRTAVAEHAAGLPRRLPGIFLVVAGCVTAVVWLGPLVTALLQGGVPARMDHYATSVTTALDLAVIAPACVVAGVYILRRRELGYRLGFPLLGIIIFLGPGFVSQTLMQRAAGVVFTTGEAVGPIAGFGAVALVALWVYAVMLLRLPARTPVHGADARAAVTASATD
jgi:hypothetical protein